MKALAFSMSRALQLDGLLRSLALHAAEPVDVEVIWKPTTDRHRAAYVQVMDAHPRARFIAEEDFEADTRSSLASAGEHVLFLVDDTIFTSAWTPSGVAARLRDDDDAIGFSLRLGVNTTNCYPLNRKQQRPPDMGVAVGPLGELCWRWPGADGDFGYPLELSSSVFRTADILTAIHTPSAIRNPNEFEYVLSLRAPIFAERRPWLISYLQSVAFSNPANRVQNTYANRAGTAAAATADSLLEQWEAGYRMDIEAYAGFEPDGAHCEVPVRLQPRP